MTMNTIKSAAAVFICAIAFQLLTQMVFNNIANGQEFTPTGLNNVKLKNPPVVKYESFLDMPHDYAVHLSSELYYHWAKEHNRRERATVRTRQHPVTRMDTTATSDSVFTGRGTTTTTIQRVDRPAANRALIIYNPFFK